LQPSGKVRIDMPHSLAREVVIPALDDFYRRYPDITLALGANGIKLSKQNHAPALPAGDPRPVLIAALKFLRQPLPESWQDLDLPLLLS
ncbi:LysR substrate-binding domain-containing protein, partial [Escherichia coli]|uniref:LysR substrate-binding domain-containing protein n=1 Tax=Escherichia coli TaxID=562 RepID=UPI0020230348